MRITIGCRRMLLAAAAMLFALVPSAPLAHAQGEGSGGSPEAPAAGLPLSQDAGLERFRAGDYASAMTVWNEALEAAEPGPERGRLAYNLGNASYRRNRFLEAVGWYMVGLRYLPRDGDLFANLELSRAEAGLPPADGGSLKDMAGRILGKFTAGESRLLALGGVLLLALILAGEALRGSSGWRSASWWMLLALPLFFAPWVRHALSPPDAHLVLQSGAGGRSEPRTDAATLERLEAGQILEVFDSMPGWSRVRLDGGQELWVQESALFQLER